MTVVNATAAMDLLKQAVDRPGYGPEFVYAAPDDAPDCVYCWDGAPSCLIGVVLHLAGGDELLEKLADSDHNDEPIANNYMRTWLSDRGVKLTEAATEVLAAAQASQDAGATWGEALERAHTTRALYGSSA